MNLFELFVKIGVEDEASEKIGEISSKIGNGLKTAAKIGTAAVTVAATAIAALTTKAVQGYSEYEQLVGGVETLFGTGGKSLQEYAASTGQSVGKATNEYKKLEKTQKSVINNASKAYKTAGMSANEYMETVTSFSASLIQSMGGDTEAAAEKANKAIIDMSDNANKMGTDMESIQNAYQGFAKQNYTMLDNLKLGYGGTKEEMKRLLETANEINAQQGIITDYQIDSYADIVDAIHVVQTEMGITGTTALEAGTTIQGSVNSMKAAWENLVTGLADGNADIESLVNDLVVTIAGDGTESNLGVIGNVLPAVETALSGASTLVSELLPKIVDLIPDIIDDNLPILVDSAVEIIQSLVDGIIESQPLLAESAIEIIQGLVDGLSENQEELVESAFEIITFLVNSIVDMLPEIVQLGLDLIVSLSNGIAESLPELIPTIISVILQIVSTITAPENLAALIDSGIEILRGIIEGIVNAIPELLDQVPTIIDNLVTAIGENTPKLTMIGIELIVKLIMGIIAAIPKLVSKAPEIVFSLIEGLFTAFPSLLQTGKETVEEIGEGFKSALSNATEWGKDLIKSFTDGIVKKWEHLKQTVKNVAQSVKNILGFSEPKEGPLSNFHTYAPDMMQLFAKGVRDNEDVVVNQVKKSFDFGKYIGSISPDESALSGFGATAQRSGSGVSVVQNIYSEAKTAADLMQEALYQQERAVMFGV